MRTIESTFKYYFNFFLNNKQKGIDYVKRTFYPVKWKEDQELEYWIYTKKNEGKLNNNHYKKYYTSHFNLQDSFYENKNILDIGCGPRGSLEWADMAKTRIGVDPLVDKYLKLGADKHKMKYVNSPSEKLPFKNNQFDAVFSFNSLDHVVNVEKTLNEIKRVLKSNGVFLLLVEVNHSPKPCEPHQLSPIQIVNFLEPEIKCQSMDLYDPTIVQGLYQSIDTGVKFANPLYSKNIGWLSAKFIKN